ncbi:ABC transporter ATP-binding protein [Pseudaquabacterium rugosum]|jgi:putative ABC transport system ATP-binding protein|uniref:ABC transporter ATP-binding protein n=1 Tax=Pseudaquabacterium rugosum TaxID=2984194 RepID=A0ABU9B6V7_9BURK
MPDAPALLDIEGLGRRYGEQAVFRDVTLRLAPGEFVALLGESGVGKSTLLNCIAGLDEPDAGRIRIAGQDLAVLDEPARAALRRQHLGFVFQAFHVLPQLSVQENVELPLRLLGRGTEAADAARRMLQAVGLEALAGREPARLSGGQLQRVALARALVHRPALLLADEPTGNLDPETAARMLDLMQDQVRAHGTACLLVTHAQAAAERADRVLRLRLDGIHPA